MSLNKEFAKRLNELNLQDKPSEPIMALGYMMRDWLSVMADKPEIDIGAGMSCFNLWAEVEGQKRYLLKSRRLTMAKFKNHVVEKDGDWSEWVYPNRKLYKMACCDCGLVHDMQFKLLPRGAGKAIVFRARRNNKSTGQMRRHGIK